MIAHYASSEVRPLPGLWLVERAELHGIAPWRIASLELPRTNDSPPPFNEGIYLADAGKWAEAGRAHKEVFGDTGRTLGWIYMSGFFDPKIAVEVECSALCER